VDDKKVCAWQTLISLDEELAARNLSFQALM
jgi:hypothetical protein